MPTTESTPLLQPPRTKSPNRLRASSRATAPLHTKRQHTATNTDALLRDITLGFSDGLTVPFALTAGLSVVGSTKIVIMGGLAELFSGMISMGLGAYNVAITERQHWVAERERIVLSAGEGEDGREREAVLGVLGRYGISEGVADSLVRELSADEEAWVRFVMDFGMGLPEPERGRAWVSAVVMGGSYFVGGLVPMVPYFFMEEARRALGVSVGISVVVLLVFGFAKTYVTVRNRRAGAWGALQTLVIGAVAAGTSYGVVRWVDEVS
ncbi:Ccc1 family [Cercophora newfieldiana]|uniref:Ccc1 family n=1 Tax=Cercophora newfieldiana TaxID=92897 RepID=A0AA40CS33_9PEZI|nr:Ccc1 family [Cercophora newfieldiana]